MSEAKLALEANHGKASPRFGVCGVNDDLHSFDAV